jgi:ABC-type sulfate transport system permease subunit
MAFGASLVLATVAIVSLLLKFAVERLMERDKEAVRSEGEG